jgi:hypothetical protein
MITAVLINLDAESKILKFNTDSEEEAFKLLLEDWINGKIVWSFEDSNIAFSKDWLKKNGYEPFSDTFTKQYENGVRVVEWHYCGEREADDHIIACYLIHSIK